MGGMVNERNLLTLKSDIRGILCESLPLPAKLVADVANRIAKRTAIAIDREVEMVVEACGLRSDELGGSFL